MLEVTLSAQLIEQQQAAYVWQYEQETQEETAEHSWGSGWQQNDEVVLDDDGVDAEPIDPDLMNNDLWWIGDPLWDAPLVDFVPRFQIGFDSLYWVQASVGFTMVAEEGGWLRTDRAYGDYRGVVTEAWGLTGMVTLGATGYGADLGISRIQMGGFPSGGSDICLSYFHSFGGHGQPSDDVDYYGIKVKGGILGVGTYAGIYSDLDSEELYMFGLAFGF